MENKRLTKKNENYNLKVNDKYNPIATTREINNKLGKLEDLEEELGYPLDRLLETNEIYVLDGDELKKYNIIGVNFKEKQIYFWMSFCPMYLSFNEYKSMYWLKEDRSE